MKDILFLNYSWVPNSTFIFKCFEQSGYSCDFVDENSLDSFIPKEKYRIVFAYLHDPQHLNKINYLMQNYFSESYFVQHDDTDFEDIQHYYQRTPNLIFHREYTVNTKTPFQNVPSYPMHFPIPSMYREEYQQKTIDVCFVGAIDYRQRFNRAAFVEKLKTLSNTSLKHLNWVIKYSNDKNIQETIKQYNQSKIIVNYPGNSHDTWRLWEAASVRSAILQPSLKLLSTSKLYLHFDDYIDLAPDYSNLESAITWLLAENRWEYWAQKSFDNYNNYHTPEKCFEMYYKNFIRHAPIQKVTPKFADAHKIYESHRI